MLPKTLTEARANAGLIIMSTPSTGLFLSTGRVVPYLEVYRDQTAVMETPAQRIQEAAQAENQDA